MSAVVVECKTVAAIVECRLCGAEGYVSQETGSVPDRIADFAAAHLAPHCIAVQVEANGIDCGWVSAEE